MKQLLAALLMVATGCSAQTPAQRQLAASEEANAQCLAMGARNHQEVLNCRMAMYNQAQAQQAAASAEYGRRMQAVGAQLLMGNHQPSQPQRRFVNCTTMPNGIGTNTTCY